MSARARSLGWAFCGVVSTLVGVAQAQDSAAAQALFERGVADLEAGRLESACPALAESHRLDPHPGTLVALAECEAKADKIASAFGHYQDYLGWVSRLSPEQQERHADRVANARVQTDLLRPRIPTLTLVLPPTAPRGLVVERDGVVLQGPALGVALPIDPGEHVVVTRDAAGNETRATVVIGAGQVIRLDLRVPNPSPAPPPVVPQAPKAPSILAPKAPKTAAPGPNPLRTWGWVAGGVGVTGVVVGSIAGVVALGQKRVVDDHCRGLACDDEGKRAANSGQSAAAVSTVAFGVGLVGLGTSLVMLLTSDRETSASGNYRPTVAFGRDAAFAGLEGAF